MDDLAAAIKAGRLDGLAGFGAKSEERYRRPGSRCTGRAANGCCSTCAAHGDRDGGRAHVPLSQRCAYAGSLRRWRETIGDIDILAAADDSAPLMAAFSAGHEVEWPSRPDQDHGQDGERA